MNHFLAKKSVFLLLVLSSFSLFSQNGYLSFKDGSKIKSEGIETTPQRTYQSLKSCDVEVGYNFSGAYVAEKNVNKITYNFIHINGFSKMSQVGAPALPAFNDIVAMPRGATGSIVIMEAEFYEYDGYMVYPTLEPAVDTEGAPSPEFKRDETIYSNNEFFPKNIVEIVSVNLSRGTGLATTQIRPVQFNPVTQKIRVYTKIKYRLETVGGEGNFSYISEENTLHYTNTLKRRVINSDCIPDGIDSEKQKKNKSGAKNYIIITHSQYISQATELANWKRQLGYSVEVISKSSWTSADIKSEIQSRYSTWTPKPDYFVIIGDHDGSYAVPGEIHQDPSYGDNFATDLYYACMDGSSDHIPDMAHGRISVSSTAEAIVVIDKIINYEKYPITDASYYQNVLNCAQWQDTDDNDGYADRRFCHTSEDIRDYLQDNQGYTSTRVYYRETGSGTADVANLHYNNGYYSDGQLLPAELRDVSFNWGGGETEITTEIDEGKFLVFHRDHGYTGGVGWAHPYYTTTSMNSLNNGDKLPVVFSINCHTGEFQLANCFSEKLLKMENKGAVGVVGAAYYSYSGYNDAISEGMIDAIWSDPGLYPDFGSAGTGGTYTIGVGNDIYTMGDVVNQGLNAMVQNFGDNTYSFELFHYFGDPAMKIWTTNPNNNLITASHNSTIDCAGSTFSVTGSTSDALATLVFNNELVDQVVLDASGNGTLSYSMTEPASEAVLTISKYNYKPYIDSLSITGSCSFPPAVSTNSATTVLDVSADLNGEITNDYGSTVTESGFVYGTSIDPEIGGTGVTQVQTSPTVTSGTFSESISGLNPTTTYYFRAYAINANGTNYGDNKSFTTACGVISSFPYTQNFDSFTLSSNPTCSNVDFSEQECWINDQINDQTDWAVNSGSTLSTGTGPSDDITGGGNYLYIETSGTCSNLISYLETPTFDFSGTEIYELSFYYHMYGATMGSLQVDLYYNSTWHTAINTDWNGVAATTISGDQGNSWNVATTDISQAQGYSDVKIRFTGLTGSSYTSDMAIDQVEVYQVIPLAYLSSTTVQNTEDTYKGETNKEIIGIQIETTGNAGSLPVRQLSFNTLGTDNTTDILNAKLYYTDTSDIFNTDYQFGTIINNPNGAFNITDSVDLLEGTNYFWLTYDISSSATIGNVVDAQCTEIIVGGNIEIPDIIDPSGAVTILTAPELNVTPKLLNAMVTECNDSTTLQFNVENTGGKDLIYSIQEKGELPNGDFESGNYNYWTLNADHTAQVVSNDPANGNYSLSLTGGNSTVFNGLSQSFTPDTISYVSVNIKPSASALHGMFAVGDNAITSNYGIIHLYFDGSNINLFNGPSHSYNPDQWYNFEFKNINYTSKTFDYYIDGVLIQSGIGFYSSNTVSISEVHLFNYQSATTYYDDIVIGSDNNWLSLSQYNDTLTAGNQQQVDVKFNAKNLSLGTYNTELIINSNDPVNTTDTIACVFTVQGDPEISISSSNFDFGDVFENGINTDTLVITNFGCDTLKISNIISSVSEFTTNISSLNIIPGGSQEVIIAFVPTSVGVVNGILTVYNNDADSTINLTGTGIAAPILSVSPSVLNPIVTACYDSITHQITISNAGGNDLDFSLQGGSNTAFDSTSTVYYSTTDATTTHLFKGLSSGVDSIYLVITINGDFDYSTEYVDIYVDGSYIGQINPNVNNTDVTGSFALGGSNVAGWISDGQVEVTLDNSPEVNTGYGTMLHQVQLKTHGVEWIGFSVENGIINSGNSQQIDVEFNAKNLNPGIYNSEIIINSNDPVNKADIIACVFTVQGHPEISISSSNFDFGDVFENGINTDTLLITNFGCDTLKISNIISSVSEFTTNITSLNIIPGGSQEVIITFVPTSVGVVNGILTVHNNDADSTINLTGIGIAAPVLSVSPSVLNPIVTECYDSITHQITISNTGGNDLDFSLQGGSSTAFDSTSTVYYSTTDAITTHLFKELSSGVDSIYLVITINGDFDYSTEYVDIYVEGSYIGQINPNVNNTDVTESFALGGSNVAGWISDGQVEVTLDNSPEVNTGYGTMLHQVKLKTPGVEWISFSTENGVINSGNSQQIDVEFNAKNLNPGIYNSEIIINSNDPVNKADTITCIFTVQGQPEISISSSNFDFGDVFENAIKEETLLISNSGCETLIVSSFGISAPEYSLNTSSLEILPGHTAEVIITFAPLSVGSFAGNIVIYNNDVDITININGEGLSQPILNVDKDQISETLTECNDSIINELRVDNTGGNDLIIQMKVAEDSNTQGGDILNTFNNFSLNNTGMVWVDEFIYALNYSTYSLEKYDISSEQIIASYPIHSMPYGIIYDGSELWIGNSSGVIYNYDLTGNALGNSINLPTSSYSAITYSDDWFYVSDAFVSNSLIYKVDFSGNVIATFAGYTGSSYQFAWANGTNSNIIWVNDFENGLIRQIELSNGAVNEISSFAFLDNNASYSMAHDGSDIWYCDWDGPLYQLSDGLSSASDWVSLSDYSDTIPSGSSTIIDVKFNNKELNEGIYNAKIIVTSNDPVNTIDTVACTFKVEYFPLIFASNTEIDFGSVSANGDTYSNTVTLSNSGCEPLEISNITTSYSVFTITQTSFILNPGESQELTVYFSPNAGGIYLGELKIYSNDPTNGEHLIELKGTGVCENIIEEQPQSVEANVGENVVFSVLAPDALSFQWRKNGSDISGEVSNTCTIYEVSSNDVGDYMCVVTSLCGDIMSNTANLSVTTSIEDLAKFGINIYPNPSNGIFNVVYSNYKQEVEVIIYSLNGTTVYKERHYSDRNLIDISSKSKGMYIIQFNMEGKLIFSNIILK